MFYFSSWITNTLFGIVLVPLIIFKVIPFLRLRFYIAKLPGPIGLPLIGSTYVFIGKTREEFVSVYSDLADKYAVKSGLFNVWMGNPFVYLCTPERAEVLLKSPKHTTKAHLYDIFKPWLREGLLLSSGSKWIARRKLITPAFHFKVLQQQYTKVVIEKARVFKDVLDEASVSHPDGFDVCPYLGRCTLDIICGAAMGVSLDAQRKPSNYATGVKRLTELLFSRTMRPMLHPFLLNYLFGNGREEIEILSVLNDFTAAVINQRSQELEEMDPKERKETKSFLDLMLNAPGLSKSDVAEEVEMFMFAGHDTSSSVLSWAFYMLALHPDLQERARIEANHLSDVSSDDDEDAPLDPNSLIYLDCFIKETMRLFPTVPLYGRHLEEDIQFEDGVTLPKGCEAIISSFSLHRNENHWTDPHKFDPERFLDDQKARHAFSFIPFSAGPRNCIGQRFAQMTLKILLVSVLHSFEIEATEDLKDVQMVLDMTLKASPGIKLKLTKIAGANYNRKFSFPDATSDFWLAEPVPA